MEGQQHDALTCGRWERKSAGGYVFSHKNEVDVRQVGFAYCASSSGLRRHENQKRLLKMTCRCEQNRHTPHNHIGVELRGCIERHHVQRVCRRNIMHACGNRSLICSTNFSTSAARQNSGLCVQKARWNDLLLSTVVHGHYAPSREHSVNHLYFSRSTLFGLGRAGGFGRMIWIMCVQAGRLNGERGGSNPNAWPWPPQVNWYPILRRCTWQKHLASVDLWVLCSRGKVEYDRVNMRGVCMYLQRPSARPCPFSRSQRQRSRR